MEAVEVDALGDDQPDLFFFLLVALELEDVLQHVVAVDVVYELIRVINYALDDYFDLLLVAVVDAALDDTAAMLVGGYFQAPAHDFTVDEVYFGGLEVAEALLDDVVPVDVLHELDNPSLDFIEHFGDRLLVVHVLDYFLDHARAIGGHRKLEEVLKDHVDYLGELRGVAELDELLAEVVGVLVAAVLKEVGHHLDKKHLEDWGGVFLALDTGLKLLAALLVLDLQVEQRHYPFQAHAQELIVVAFQLLFFRRIHVHHVLHRHYVHHRKHRRLVVAEHEVLALSEARAEPWVGQVVVGVILERALRLFEVLVDAGVISVVSARAPIDLVGALSLRIISCVLPLRRMTILHRL